jgi:integrase
MNLEKALGIYAEELQFRGCARSHIASVQNRIGRFVAGRGEGLVTAVSPADIAAHFDQLESSGLARGTLAGHKSTHRAFWGWLLDQGHILADPSSVLTRKQFAYSYRPVNHRAANEAAFVTVLESLPQFVAAHNQRPRDIRDALAVSLAADSAARRGEIWAIRRKDLERALKRPSPLPNGGYVYHVSSDGKTGQSMVRFFDQSAEFARMWLEILPGTAVHVFASTKTWNRLPRDYMNSAFNRVCAFAGVEPFRWQAVRKRVVTNIIALTGNVTAGQRLAGHASEKTTLAYYNDVQEASVDAAAGELARQRRGGGGGGDGLADAFFSKIQPPKS